MARAVGFHVDGLNGAVRDLQAIGLEIDDLKAAFAKVADEGAAQAARLAPRQSGALAAGVRGNRAKSKAVVTAGGRAVPYAGPINYGWPARGIAPALFMQRADELMQPIALQRLEEEINQQIRRRGLK